MKIGLIKRTVGQAKIGVVSVLFLTLFSLTPNVSATNLSIDVAPKWTNFSSTWQFYVYQGASGTNWIGSGNSASPDAAYKNMRKVRFSLPNGIILGRGDYVTTDLMLRQNVANNSLDLSVGPMKSDTSGITLISAEVAQSSNTQTVVHFTFYVETTITVSNTSTYVTVGSTRGNDANIIWWFDTVSSASDIQAIGGISNYYSSKTSTDYSGSLGNINTGITNLNNKLNQTNNKIDSIQNSLNQAKQDTQSAQNQADSSGDTATSDSETATTSLLNTITGAVTAISSVSPTNCKLNGNMGHLNTGEMDLCNNPVPTFITVIGSLLLILAIVPLAIHLFNLFISITRSFQQ